MNGNYEDDLHECIAFNTLSLIWLILSRGHHGFAVPC